jgi:hypothetical protein
MSIRNHEQQPESAGESSAQSGSEPKRPYEKPAIAEDVPLTMISLACCPNPWLQYTGGS